MYRLPASQPEVYAKTQKVICISGQPTDCAISIQNQY